MFVVSTKDHYYYYWHSDYFPPLMVKVRICGCRATRNQVHSRHGEHLQLFKKILVFRITTTVSHSSFLYVCAGVNVFVCLCVLLYFPPFLPLLIALSRSRVT